MRNLDDTLVIQAGKSNSFSIKELWLYRELLYFFPWRDIKVRYKQTFLGAGWAILQPLLAAAIFTLFFNRVAKINSGAANIPYPVFAYLGLMYWNAFSGALNTVSNSLLSNSGVINKIYFPRLIPPFSATALSMVDFCFAAAVFFILLLIFGVMPGLIGILLIIPCLLLIMVAAFSIGLFFAALNIKYRDVRSALPYLIQIAFFVTPVIYPISMIPERYQNYAYLNPATGAISTVKAGIFQQPINWTGLLISCISTLVFLAVGLWYFKRAEKKLPGLSMKPVIDVKGISKSYQISHQNSSSYGTLKDDFSNLIKKPFGGGEQNEQETFWALKDINFQVNQGETFGVIGKNGSGKSTLLKILSRIVDPTSGSVKIHGKVASLLEVGTGFHPELTGRENIYFNGSIIGMSKQEITRKFDEIVDFSGVEKFLDTPVKFYSSGMFVRLAFSVAANLDSEILILDEVLSVGDVEFQKKSLNKMLSIAKEGRTILFVSHSMSSIQDICSKAMLLHKGKVKFIGSSDAVADRYLRENMPVQKLMLDVEKKKQRTKVSLIGRKDRQGSGKIIFNAITDIKWDPETRKMNLAMTYDNVEGVSINNAKISVALRDTETNRMLCNTNDVLNQRIDLSEGGGTISLEIYDVNLETGEYNIELFMASDLQNGEILDWVNRAAKIEINNDKFYTTGHVPPTREVVLFNFKYEAK